MIFVLQPLRIFPPPQRDYSRIQYDSNFPFLVKSSRNSPSSAFLASCFPSFLPLHFLPTPLTIQCFQRNLSRSCCLSLNLYSWSTGSLVLYSPSRKPSACLWFSLLKLCRFVCFSSQFLHLPPPLSLSKEKLSFLSTHLSRSLSSNPPPFSPNSLQPVVIWSVALSSHLDLVHGRQPLR